MNDTIRMLRDTLERICTDHGDKAVVDALEAGTFPDALWTAVAEAGLDRASVPEAAGGSGLGGAELLALLRVGGRHALPLPLLEHQVALALLAAVGAPLPDGLATLGRATLDVAPGADAPRLSGVVAAVPWARHAASLVVLHQGGAGLRVATVPLGDAGVTIRAGANVAGEPEDAVTLDGVEAVLHALPAGVEARLDEVLAAGCAARMAGALERLLAIATGYAMEREQFGRPIAKFQAVQHQLAVLAGEVAAATRAVDAAAERAGDALLDPDDARADVFAVRAAVAKARVGEAAGPATEIAHQVLGAMGFTHEHALHQYTRRLWAWRDQHGSDVRWQTRLGERVLAEGADGLWAFLTAH
jgi:acyl-CoA dehydrogenase